MVKKEINQNDTFALELLGSIEHDYIFDNNSINRLKNSNNNKKTSNNEKIKKILDLKEELNSIKDCKIKNHNKQIVLGDGNIDSSLMFVGSAPSEKDALSGKTFIGNDGKLLEKMLSAINIKKRDVYSTYVVNYQPHEDRKPTTEEINRYKPFLQKHISIINPKLIILMGSTAMEALTGLNDKISIERGKWKEIIIKNISYKVIITFDPSYLLRFPENKKFSWEDLKKIKQKIIDLNLDF